jgi:phosphotransferase system enzyme I (PtsI)
MTSLSQTVSCIALSPGIAIGRVLPMHSPGRSSAPEKREISPDNVDFEVARLNEAIAASRSQIEALQSGLKDNLDDHLAQIFDAHLLLVDDRMMCKAVEKHIRSDFWNAEYAVYVESEHYISVLEQVQDEYLRERSADLRDVAGRIISNLTDQEIRRFESDGRRIVVAHSLSPSETAGLDQKNTLGFAVESGGVASHTALLARSMGIPAVAGVPADMIDQIWVIYGKEEYHHFELTPCKDFT